MSYVVKDKLGFLAEASKILSSSLDYKLTLDNLASLVINNIADFCTIDIADKQGVLKRVAARTSHPKKAELAKKMLDFPPDPKSKKGIYQSARTGKPILIPKATSNWMKNATHITQEHEIGTVLGLRSFIFTPLRSRGKVIGVLTVISSKKNFSYSKDDVVLAQELADRAGIAVDNALLFSQTKKNLKLLENVNEATLKFLVPLDLEETYKTISFEALNLVNADFATLDLIEKGKLKNVYSTYESLGTIVKSEVKFLKEAYAKQKTQFLRTPELKKFSKHKDLGIKLGVLVPLENKGSSVGTINVFFQEDNFSDEDRLSLELFSPLATMAIRKAQLYAEIESALQTRDLFISLASHELRTPLTTAYTYLQIQQRRMEKGGKLEKEWIDITMNELMRLNNLVDGLLQLNQIKRGILSYNFRRVHLTEVILTALRSFKTMHKKREVAIRDDTSNDDLILGDFERLTQVLINVLDNAAKNSPSDSVISIGLKKNRKSIVVEVEDRGKGFESNDVKRAFEAFYKDKNNTKAGMGLGLYLSKQIVDYHKGKIQLLSKKNKGTTVRILLPRKNLEI